MGCHFVTFYCKDNFEYCGWKLHNSTDTNMYTLVYRIEVQAQINVQVGEFLEINRRVVRNKRAGETSYKKMSNVQDFTLNDAGFLVN